MRKRIGRPNQRPLVGRGKEMARLFELLQFTKPVQRPHCVMLSGDMGVGKTRLAEEVAREAERRNWAVIWCQAYAQESEAPYQIWTDALRKAIKDGLWQLQGAMRFSSVYQPLCQLLPELQNYLPQTRQVVPLFGQKQRLWEATCELLSAICTHTPLLVVLDDTQWADSNSSDLFIYLVRWMATQQARFLCTCREAEMPASHVLHPQYSDLQREQLIETLPIEPLDDREICTLLAELPTSLAEQIAEHVTGVPFFAEELAKQFSVDTPVTEVPILPSSVKRALAERLWWISRACRHLLDTASVLNTRLFTFAELEHLAKAVGTVDLAGEGLVDALDEALRLHLLKEVVQTDRTTYHFQPDLLGFYFYQMLPRKRRELLLRAREQEQAEDASFPRCAFCSGHLSSLPLPESAMRTMPDDLPLTYRCLQCHRMYQAEYRLITLVALSVAAVPTALIRRCAQCHRLYRDGEVHRC